MQTLGAALFDEVVRPCAIPFALDSAYQGQEGLAMVRTACARGTPYAMAFVDMRMPPGWDGIETIEHLWREDPALQIVICTAYSDYAWTDVLERLETRDRLLILKKPFDNIEVHQLASTLTVKWTMMRQAATYTDRLEQEVQARMTELLRTNRALELEIAERRSAEQALRVKDQAIASSIDAIFLMSNDTLEPTIDYVNPAFERLTGYAQQDIVGQGIGFLYAADRSGAGVEIVEGTLQAGVACQAVLCNYRKDGSPFWSEWHIAPVHNEHAQLTHFVGVISDITQARLAEQQLQHRADFDGLTSLPNRLLFMDRLHQALASATRDGEKVAVAFIDLNRFKHINDTLGHDAGDILLREIGKRLTDCVRQCDTVARLGGDEFAVVLRDPVGEHSGLPVMQRIVDRAAQPVILLGAPHAVTCSIGISVFPQDGEDADTLLKCADRAMYLAKDVGRNAFLYFVPEMNTRLNDLLTLERDLHSAFERDELDVYFQPRLDTHSGKLHGCEALIRRRHPQRGVVALDGIIPLVHDNALTLQTGQWAMRQACRQVEAWARELKSTMSVAITLSSVQFDHHDFAASIDALLREVGLAPHRLHLGLSEAVAMRNPANTTTLIGHLRRLGVGVALTACSGTVNLHALQAYNAMLGELRHTFDTLEQRVSERTQALASSLAVLNATLDSTADGIFAQQHASGAVHYNSQFCNMWGIPRTLLERRNDAELNAFIGAQVVDQTQFMAHAASLMADPEQDAFDILALRDGRTFERYCRPQQLEGKTVGIVINYRDVSKRVRAESQLKEAQSALLATARQAGMAEIATNVLHNVGNVLNSVNVSAELARRMLHTSELAGLARSLRMMNEHEADLGQFMTVDARGKLLLGYLNLVAAALEKERRDVSDELGHLSKSVDHIKEIVATQQSYAGPARLIEMTQVQALVEDALRMEAGAMLRHRIRVEKHFAAVPDLPLDKHKVLQILINLISNAKHAMEAVPHGDHLVTLRVDVWDDTAGRRLRVEVQDNGEGILPEHLVSVFGHGFTTRKNGHGFGLHSCALAAREMGGTLVAHSDGPGKGALFVLEIPVPAAASR